MAAASFRSLGPSAGRNGGFLSRMTRRMPRIFPVVALLAALSALSALSALVMALLVLRGATEGRVLYLDVALVYDIFGFLGVLAVASFIRDRKSEDDRT